jgi:hypothetical protein
MPEYTLIIEIPNAGNRQIRNSVNLTGSFVDFPGDYFRKPENRAKLKTDIETQSARQVSEADLDFFIKEWCRDIKQGLNPTTVRRDLPPVGIATPTSTPSPTRTSVSDRDRPRDNKVTSTGSNSGYPPVKTPNPQGISGTSSGGKSQSSGTGNTQSLKEESSKTKTWSTSNDADF